MDIQITVADIVLPAPGKKQGKIIDHTGKEWQVWGDKMGMYSRGNSYSIQKYKTSEFKGKTYYTIEEVTPVGGGAQGGAIRPVAPSTQNMGSGPTPAPATYSETERRMDIFICGALNNILANPNVNPVLLQAADMIEYVKRLKATWISTLGPGNPSSGRTLARNADLNDSLPDNM